MEKSGDILDANEAARYLKIHVQTIRRLARNGEIPVFRVGGSWRFKRSSLDRWAESQLDVKRPRHVLAVDDDPAVLEFIRRAMESEEFSVALASGGAEALELMRGRRPDLVVLDLMMEGMNGPATLKEIRNTYGSLPVIILTGYPDSELVTQAMEYSPIMLLSKPLGREALLEAARTALGAGGR